MATTFKLGDTVTWASQAQGFRKTKTGKIVEVVSPGRHPDRDRFLQLHQGSGVGMCRDQVSYVVEVGKKHYWPHASKLSAAQ